MTPRYALEFLVGLLPASLPNPFVWPRFRTAFLVCPDASLYGKRPQLFILYVFLLTRHSSQAIRVDEALIFTNPPCWDSHPPTPSLSQPLLVLHYRTSTRDVDDEITNLGFTDKHIRPFMKIIPSSLPLPFFFPTDLFVVDYLNIHKNALAILSDTSPRESRKQLRALPPSPVLLFWNASPRNALVLMNWRSLDLFFPS